MPLYEYKCLKCDKTFEVMQKFSDAPLTVHEDCGGHVEKQLSAPAFQLKGSGWYVTDYGKGNSGPKTDTHKSESKSGESAAEKSESKSESKSAETKSESKTEAKPAAKTD